MKKLLLLCLVLLGGVMQVSATDYIVAGMSAIANGQEWANNADVNKMISVNSNQYYLVVEGCNLTKGTTYQFKVVPKGSWEPCYPNNNKVFEVDQDGTYTLIYTFYRSSDSDYEVNVVPVDKLTLSNNYNGANVWDVYNSNAVFSHTSGTYKWTLNVPACSVTSDYWYFRIFKYGLLKANADAGKNKIRPNESDAELTIGGGAYTSTWIGTETKSWKVPYIDYPYNYYTITAEYNVAERYANNWKVSVDAYISKTLNKDYTYATLGSGAKLDLSGLSTEGVTAYRLTADYSTKKITKGDAFSGILDANKGVLLEYSITDNKTLEIPVSASDATSGSNDMVACTTSHIDQVDGDGYTKYILADQDGKVGFYMVNETYGNDMGGYTAYLNVLNTADTNEAGENAARDFFVLEGETTGIANLNVNDNANFNADAPMYNLAGQRVNKSYKGVIIVNGKKMLNK